MKVRLFLLLVICFTTGARAQHAWNVAAKFDGSSYLSNYESAVNANSGRLTVECWVKPDEDSSSASIVGKSQFRIMTDRGRIRVQVAGLTIGYSDGYLPGGKWSHVAVTFNAAAGSCVIYLNGYADKNLSFSGTFAGTNDSLIAGHSSYASDFKGHMDELRLWKVVRTANDIYQTMRTHISWYLTGYYNPDLLYAQTYDFDVYSPGLYLPGGRQVGTMAGTTIGATASTSVKHNSAMYFTDGAYLESYGPNDPDVSLTGPVTVEAWVKPTATGTVQHLFDLTSGGGGYLLSLNAAGQVVWQMGGTTGNTEANLEQNTWSHIAVVCHQPVSGNQVCDLYINGKKDKAYNFNALEPNTGKLRIGASHTGANAYKGYIDEFRVSNFAKTEAELLRDMHTPILYINRPEAPRITAAYNFDGQMNAGTRAGFNLYNYGARYTLPQESAAPTLFTGPDHQQTMDSFIIRHVSKRVPAEGTAGYTYDSIEIKSRTGLSALRVFIALSHNAPRDLRIELISPQGDSVTLIDEEYRFYSSKDLTTIFHDGDGLKISDNEVFDIAPAIAVSGSFAPFYNKSPQGIWRLKITDLANGNTGVLHSWGLLMPGAGGTGIAAPEEQSGVFRVSPNPGTGLFTLHTAAEPGKLTVYNALGQVALHQQLAADQDRADLSAQPSGIYIFEYWAGTSVSRQKVILDR